MKTYFYKHEGPYLIHYGVEGMKWGVRKDEDAKRSYNKLANAIKNNPKQTYSIYGDFESELSKNPEFKSLRDEFSDVRQKKRDKLIEMFESGDVSIYNDYFDEADKIGKEAATYFLGQYADTPITNRKIKETHKAKQWLSWYLMDEDFYD